MGDSRPQTVDIRVLAATNRNLEQEVAAGTFRDDLFYRLNVVHVHLPPLRERGDDVVMLGKYVLERAAQDYGRPVTDFAPDALIALKKYSWPGNIRQLENHIKKAVVMAEKKTLSAHDLELEEDNLPPIAPLAQAKEDFQRRYINEILDRNNGNRTKTAKDLGVDPRTIFRHLEREAGE